MLHLLLHLFIDIQTLVRIHLIIVDAQVVDDWSGQSYRILAIAKGTVHGVSSLKLGGMGLQQVEDLAYDLELVGLNIISNHLHHDSKETVTQLRDE